LCRLRSHSATEAKESDARNINPRHTIFVVEEDNSARRSLTKDLRELGYRLLVAADLEDAFEWVSSEYIHADLLLMDLAGKQPEESLSIARRVREHCKYDGHTAFIECSYCAS
jgi:CheY-like chemotaxis protein